MTRRLIHLALALAVIAPASAAPAGAFWDDPHLVITQAGLSGPKGQFVHAGVFDDIMDEHAVADGGAPPSFRKGQDQYHFDDCEFDGGAEFIRDRYADARSALSRRDPLNATDHFGLALHPAQDFYSHSNWVELGFPEADNPATPAVEVSFTDLVDMSGWRGGLDQSWFSPPFMGTVRGDILVDHDDDFVLPPGTRVSAGGRRGTHVPVVEFPGRAGRLLVSGSSFGDTECGFTADSGGVKEDGTPLIVPVYAGISHADLNKDGPVGEPFHEKAKAIAKLQTSWEWCRLVREAARVQRDGMLIASFVSPGAQPHPLGTPCAPGPPGPTAVTLTVESIKVRDSGDSDRNDPGEIQVAVALYDDPASFHRSIVARTELARGARPLPIDDGEEIPKRYLPPPLTLCVGNRATVTVHGWDNDQDDDDPNHYRQYLDDKGDDDEFLTGFQQQVLAPGAILPRGSRVGRSADLEVRYRLSGSTGPRPGCPPAQVRASTR